MRSTDIVYRINQATSNDANGSTSTSNDMEFFHLEGLTEAGKSAINEIGSSVFLQKHLKDIVRMLENAKYIVRDYKTTLVTHVW